MKHIVKHVWLEKRGRKVIARVDFLGDVDWPRKLPARRCKSWRRCLVCVGSHSAKLTLCTRRICLGKCSRSILFILNHSGFWKFSRNLESMWQLRKDSNLSAGGKTWLIFFCQLEGRRGKSEVRSVSLRLVCTLCVSDPWWNSKFLIEVAELGWIHYWEEELVCLLGIFCMIA
jgi:hypothetical protein